jgi:fructuronate reductase
LEEVQQYIRNIEFANVDSVGDHLKPILSNKKIFGIDLYEAGLGEKVERFFKQLIKGPGAVRATLNNQISK